MRTNVAAERSRRVRVRGAVYKLALVASKTKEHSVKDGRQKVVSKISATKDLGLNSSNKFRCKMTLNLKYCKNMLYFPTISKRREENNQHKYLLQSSLTSFLQTKSYKCLVKRSFYLTTRKVNNINKRLRFIKINDLRLRINY